MAKIIAATAALLTAVFSCLVVSNAESGSNKEAVFRAASQPGPVRTKSVSVSVTNNESATPPNTVVEIDFTDLSPEELKDLHMWSARNHVFPQLSGGTTVTATLQGGGSQTWEVRRTNGGTRIDLFSDDEAGFPPSGGSELSQ